MGARPLEVFGDATSASCLLWKDSCHLASAHFCGLCHCLGCDIHRCQVCLIFHSFDLLKNQNVRVNLKILYRLTMGLCSQLKARRLTVT